MQTNQNSKVLFVEEEINRDESHLSDQSKRKSAIQQRITAYLNLTNIEV
jgi:hypothetical protein